MEDWIHVSQTSGSGNAAIEISADENTSVDSRTGTVTITPDGADPVIITVIQAGADANLSVDSNTVNLDAQGTAQTVS